MDTRSCRLSTSFVRAPDEADPGKEDWSDSDSLDLPLYAAPRLTGLRGFVSRWYRALVMGLLAVVFVTTWATTLVLTWRLASEQPCGVSWAASTAGGGDGGGRGGPRPAPMPESSPPRVGHEALAVGNGSLHVPGYRLAYNASYCDGVRDPDGARARGCIFDPIQTGWMPGPCVDADLTREFKATLRWQWFEDEERTRPTSQEVVLQGNGGRNAFTVDDYHYRHCEFVIRQLIRNFLSPRPAVGFKMLQEEHLEHCLDRLINYNTPEIRNAWTEHVRWTGSGECYERIVS